VPSLELVGTPRAPRDARRFVDSALDSWGVAGDRRDAIRLLATELVTNALLHGAPPIIIEARRSGVTIRVSVQDGNPTPPSPRPFDVEAPTGHGMLLVQRLSRRWGVEPAADGKLVWFEIDAGFGDVADAAGARVSSLAASPPSLR
jgi:anti-sigma regulatory factor (Ser/Thr protein kinase)